MSEPNDDAIDRRLAALGLALQPEAETLGPRPDEDELWDFIHGAVSDQRREEILSHLADDQRVFDEWYSLRQAIKEYGEPEEELSVVDEGLARVSDKLSLTATLKSWLSGHIGPVPTPLAAAAAAVACVSLVLVLSLRPSDTPADFWLDWSAPISTQATTTQEQQDAAQSLLVGVKNQLLVENYSAVGPSGEVLPDELPACGSDDTDCVSRQDALVQLGELAVGQIHQCQTEQGASENQGDDIASVAAPVLAQGQPDSLLSLINAWITAQDSDPGSACDASAEIISWGFRQ